MSTNYTNSINSNFKSAKREIEQIKTNYTPLQTTQRLNELIESLNSGSASSDIWYDSATQTLYIGVAQS